MKRGFLSPPSVPKDTKPSPQPVNAKRKKSDEAEARTQPDIQNAPKESYPTKENVAQILEAEVLREKLAHEMVEVKLDCLYVRFTRTVGESENQTRGIQDRNQRRGERQSEQGRLVVWRGRFLS